MNSSRGPSAGRVSDRLASPRIIFAGTCAVLWLMITLACGAGAAPDLAPIGSALPTATQQVVLAFQLTALSPAPAIPETRRLTLEYPTKMRAGVDTDIVRLTLEVDELGNITPTAEVAGNQVTGQTVQIPDLYDTHNVTAEARLDMAGMQISPSDSIFEALSRGQSATFRWSIRPQDAGSYRGTVWLHLNFADKVSGEQSRIAVSAQVFEIEAVDFFGLTANVARTGGVVGALIGGVIGFPFIDDILKFIFKKRRS